MQAVQPWDESYINYLHQKFPGFNSMDFLRHWHNHNSDLQNLASLKGSQLEELELGNVVQR